MTDPPSSGLIGGSVADSGRYGPLPGRCAGCHAETALVTRDVGIQRNVTATETNCFIVVVAVERDALSGTDRIAVVGGVVVLP